MASAIDHSARDRDTAAVIASLRAAVRASGLSQAAFATTLGTSAPRLSTYLSGTVSPSAHTLLRADRLARALAATRERGLMSAPVTAAAVRTHLRTGRTEWAWRMLLQGRDHLRLLLHEDQDGADGPGRPPVPVLLDAWEAAPGGTGHPGFDTLLAALTAREHRDAGRTPPAWAHPVPLPEPWIPQHPFLSPERVRAQTPPWLRELNVHVTRRDLSTA